MLTCEELLIQERAKVAELQTLLDNAGNPTMEYLNAANGVPQLQFT